MQTDPTTASLGVREDAYWVMERARHVSFDLAAIERAAAEMATRDVPVPAWNDALHFTDHTPRTANYLLVLDGLNFSFWGQPRWGITYKGQALRGYWALAAALKRAIEAGVPLTDARFMAACTEAELRQILRGQGEIPLFEARLKHLHELGEGLLAHFDGEFANAITRCNGSAVALARLVARVFPNFEDTSEYDGRTIHLYKRAQILPADLWGAFNGQGLGAFNDIDQLTAFADYKVPQVLEWLGILDYEQSVAERIVMGVELPHGSPEEVEIRCATVAGVELLRAALARHGRAVTAVQMDWILWEMGLTTAPDAPPYHLTRTTAY